MPTPSQLKPSALPMWSNATFQFALCWTILIGYTAIVLSRAPDIAWPGRFWGEEGTIYFREAFLNSPLRVLATPHLGYYSLLNQLAALAAAHIVPLRLAPVITMLFALAIQVLPAALLLFGRIPSLPTLFHRITAVALVLLVQPNQEVWLNTVNSQYFLCVITSIVLISRPTSRPAHLFRLLTLALAGLTGIVSSLLLPLFFAAYWHERQKHRRHEIFALGLASLIQVAVVMAGAGRAVQPVWALLPLALLGKQWVLPLFGYSGFDAFIDLLRAIPFWTRYPWVLTFLLPYAACAGAVYCLRNRTAAYLLAASLGVAVVSLCFSLPAQHLDTFGYSCITATADGRYVYAPNVLLSLSFLVLIVPRRIIGIQYIPLAGASVLLLLLLATGIANFRHYGAWSHGPDWPTEVRAWHEGRTEALAIWPVPWQLNLRPARPAPE